MNTLQAWNWLSKQYGVTVNIDHDAITIIYPNDNKWYRGVNIIDAVLQAREALG